MSARQHASRPSTPHSGTPFDPKSYRETRRRQHSGLCRVGHTGMGKRYIQWLHGVRRTVLLRLLRSLGTDLSTAWVFDVGSGTGLLYGVVEATGGWLDCRMRLDRDSRATAAGFVYLLERLLTKILRASATTEIIACRKRPMGPFRELA